MPYFGSTMAIVLSIFVAAWLHNKHIDTLNHRIEDTNRRIDETTGGSTNSEPRSSAWKRARPRSRTPDPQS